MILLLLVLVSALCCPCVFAVATTTSATILQGAFAFTQTFRDPRNGLYCDSISLDTVAVCGDDDASMFYSSAGTGMGLVAECVFAELGLVERNASAARVLETLESVNTRWPREPFTGFLVHFTNHSFAILSEFSTVDTAELVAGALFAGHYFQGAILEQALQLAHSVTFSKALAGPTNPVIFPVVNQTNGHFSGTIRPYNEYFIISYLARVLEGQDPGSLAAQYWHNFFSTVGAHPPTGLHGYPVAKNFADLLLLTDNETTFMSSFIPLFCFFLTKGFNSNTYYASVLSANWLEAEQMYWDSTLNATSVVWGTPVYGKIFGFGAGDSPDGYSVNRIGGNKLVFSAAIMAGFLAVTPDANAKAHINAQLEWLFTEQVCLYKKPLSSRATADVLWRCSLDQNEWRAQEADFIDFSTYVLGYAANFLPADFYRLYAI